MKKTILTLMLACIIQGHIFAQSDNLIITDSLHIIDLTYQVIDKPIINDKGHRVPPQIPCVYISISTSVLYFEDPCYECTLELIVPGTETVAYTYSIPDGDNVVVLPERLSGQYELHIHRGNFCFWGLIEL